MRVEDWERGECEGWGGKGEGGSDGKGGRPWVDCSISGGVALAFSSRTRARCTASE